MQDKIKKIETKLIEILEESGHGELIIKIADSEIVLIEKIIKEKIC